MMDQIREVPRAQRIKRELLGMLEKRSFTRFVTLTFNDARLTFNGRGVEVMRRAVKDFDARISRKLLGREWLRRPDVRPYFFFVPEKISSNPHWHGLVNFEEQYPGDIDRQHKLFDAFVEPTWKGLVRSGSADVQRVYLQGGVADYIAKTLQYELYYEHFIVPREFWPR